MPDGCGWHEAEGSAGTEANAGHRAIASCERLINADEGWQQPKGKVEERGANSAHPSRGWSLDWLKSAGAP
jgi:hypothetical protein